MTMYYETTIDRRRTDTMIEFSALEPRSQRYKL